jgi:hypothetical protein
MRKRFWAILSLALITICSSTDAQVPAASYLAMCQKNWPCGASINAFNELSVLRFGWLEKTFGDSCPCVDKLLQDERDKVVRIHIANGPCLRNRRCGRYEIFAGHTIASANRDIKRAKSRIVPRYLKVLERLRARLAKARGGFTCYVSPVLESDLDEQAREILYRITASHLPTCTLVDNPLRARCLRGYVCEKHGPSPRLSAPCIADLDGIDANTISVPEYLRQTSACDMSFIWSVGLNCNSHHSTAFVDPRERNCAQSRADIEGLVGWLRREFK